MPTYKVTNRKTKEAAIVEAPYAQDACQALGWQIGYCYVQVVREGPYTDLAKRPIRIGPQRRRKGVRDGEP